MASQDSWAKPLAKQLVDLFRVNSFNYIRTTEPVYDPAKRVTLQVAKRYTPLQVQ